MKCVLYLLVVLAAAVGFSQSSETVQDQKPKSSRQSLELTTNGEINLSKDRRGIFRTYTAPDGSKGTVSYAQFRSISEAKVQIREWMKLVNKITSREEKKDRLGRVFSERIMAMRREAKTNKEEFLIVRRNGLNCYFIQSYSLPVVVQIEQLIEPE